MQDADLMRAKVLALAAFRPRPQAEGVSSNAKADGTYDYDLLVIGSGPGG